MRLLIMILVAGLLLFGCSGAPTKPVNGTSSGKTVEINMTVKQFGYSPSVINVQKGDHVKLTITSLDVAHGFSLPDFNVNAQIPAGKTAVVEFDADKAGTFEFRCSVFCGSGHGDVKGTLIVK
ncbi:MAG: cupredoxin domain-containing protein [Candidatus Micrarchaeia archaeon]